MAKAKKNVIKQFDLTKKLSAGFNPDFLGSVKKVPVFHVPYERNGVTVRFVEFDGVIVPLAGDIPRAMWPNNGDEWHADVSRSTVFIKDGPHAWREEVVAKDLDEARKIADGSFWRYGMGTSKPQYDSEEAEHMKSFLTAKICEMAKSDIGKNFYPDFKHTFGDREGLCIQYTCADSGEEAVAEIEASYREIVEANKRRDKQKTKPRERASSAKIEFTQQEVCRRAMAVHACEVAHEAAKRRLIDFASIYKAMHGISRLDFADEFYQHFSRHALSDRYVAEHELKLANMGKNICK